MSAGAISGKLNATISSIAQTLRMPRLYYKPPAHTRLSLLRPPATITVLLLGAGLSFGQSANDYLFLIRDGKNSFHQPIQSQRAVLKEPGRRSENLDRNRNQMSGGIEYRIRRRC